MHLLHEKLKQDSIFIVKTGQKFNPKTVAVKMDIGPGNIYLSNV